MSELPSSTPVITALRHLRDTTRLTVADYDALTDPTPPGVHTLGDLAVVVERGEIENKTLARKLDKLLNG